MKLSKLLLYLEVWFAHKVCFEGKWTTSPSSSLSSHCMLKVKEKDSFVFVRQFHFIFVSNSRAAALGVLLLLLCEIFPLLLAE